MLHTALNGLTPVAQGAARQLDFMRAWHDGVGAGAIFYARGGGASVSALNISSNMGFPANVEQRVTRQGVVAFRARNGAFGSAMFRVPLNTRETLIRSWPVGVWVWECMLQCSIETDVGIENGMWFSDVGISRVFFGSGQGFGISAVTGEGLCFFVNGPLGVQRIQLTGISVQTWHHVRWVFRNRSASKNARLQLYVNDSLKVVKHWDVAADNMPAFPDSVTGQDAWHPQWGIATAGAADWVYYRDQHFYCGPDIPSGVI